MIITLGNKKISCIFGNSSVKSKLFTIKAPKNILLVSSDDYILNTSDELKLVIKQEGE